MKKYLIAIAVIFTLAASLQAVKQAKKEVLPVITSAMQLTEALQKKGVTGSESEAGILPKILVLLGLKQFRQITGHNYSVQIYDFKSASGFNMADSIFHFYDMLSDDEVYKSRPFLICVDFPNEEIHKKILEALKALIPDIKTAGEKEF
jgi:hypothetical protein